MLEGKEVEGKMGEYGNYSVDITPKGKIIAAVSVEIDIVGELKKLAAKTTNKVDDKMVAMIEAALGNN